MCGRYSAMGRGVHVRTALRWVALAVAVVGQLSGGIVFLFSTFQNPLKATYNYTQSEVAVLASLSYFGVGMSLIPGMVFDKYGPTVTSVLGLIISLGGYLLVWSTTKSIQFYKTKSWLAGIYFLTGGIGSTFVYIATLYTSIMNFAERYRGAVCGLMNSGFSIGPVAFILIYYQFFVHGSKTIDSNHDYAGFMLFTAVVLGVVSLFCVIFLRIYGYDDDNNVASESSELKEFSSSKLSKKGTYGLQMSQHVYSLEVSVESLKDSDNSISRTYNEEESHLPKKESEAETTSMNEESFFALIKNPDFHLFLWMFSICSALGIVHMNNVTTTTKSMKQTEYDTYVVLIIPLVSVVASFAIGFSIDRLKDKWPRSYFLCLGNIMYTVCGIMYTIRGDNLVVMMTASALSGVGLGISWSVAPVYLSELYGTDHFGRNWGIFMILSAAVVFGSQAIFGSLYDSHVNTNETVICYGFKCVQSGYGALLAISIFGLILNIVMIANETRKKNR